ncbi:30S ribosomal protein S5 [Candidatus Hydrogenosomobacter endosymbioticus]|uniref:Small ribosomal subunit protein uS5 n=1 Tax=Candidatus Hydrogenosomobacter endosymbioticus TaxID=2558174 RepID=A0ABM7V8A4_9PROT|nr:30S ribosomal protein S5 [Candidatus Hydrogenosomobacter endosymbioticus]BDB95999.1 30S ribosomal protein S5 [Candidatus Hydrogenosomobacter endosymbioticus]
MVRERSSKPADKELIRRFVSVSRVSKVVKGGKRFNFSALVVVGDGKGSVGYGAGKAREVSDALRKAGDIATRSMRRVPLKEGRTVHQDHMASFGAGKVFVRSAPKGTGVIAGGAMRAVFEAVGVQDIVAKVIGSSNPHNVVKATVRALEAIQSPRMVANKRGKKIFEVFGAAQSSPREKVVG